jgi:UDP-N-acetylglucosamine 1-carboxyvinyltransferase
MSSKVRIIGGTPLQGKIRISGAKNAALPLMTASLLTDQTLTLCNVPNLLADINSMAELLAQFGVSISSNDEEKIYTLKAETLHNTLAPYDIVNKMRASILVLGPLVARCGHAEVSLPGGCAIGTRPVDIHLKGLRDLGAEIEISEGYINARAPAKGLVGASITMPLISVTGTENLMMAACLAKGETRLINAAREPEVIDLANCLIGMGAQIQGAGTDTITIQGVDHLHEYKHQVMPDRIETGTYAMASVITGGSLELTHTSLELIQSLAGVLHQAGIELKSTENGIFVTSPSGDIQGIDVMTEPFPGFATDLQAQTMALMAVCNGASMITETIFENRFMHVPELCRMGANITVHGASALVRGVKNLNGAPVMATDLRASVCLVLAALAARGETTISRVYHLDRGYEQVEDKLRNCGATIERINTV